MDWPVVTALLVVPVVIACGIWQRWLSGGDKPLALPVDNRILLLKLREDHDQLARDLEAMRGDVDQLMREVWGDDA